MSQGHFSSLYVFLDTNFVCKKRKMRISSSQNCEIIQYLQIAKFLDYHLNTQLGTYSSTDGTFYGFLSKSNILRVINHTKVRIKKMTEHVFKKITSKQTNKQKTLVLGQALPGVCFFLKKEYHRSMRN